jgi:hypothetical protein
VQAQHHVGFWQVLQREHIVCKSTLAVGDGNLMQLVQSAADAFLMSSCFTGRLFIVGQPRDM